MKTFKQFVAELINDRGILKAVFVIGLPGAGKSYTISKIRGPVSPVVVNTDKSIEFLSKKMDIEVNRDTWHNFADKSAAMTKEQLTQYVNGMLPLFVDGTSNDVSNILNRIGILESLGYDVGVVFVSASLGTAMKRAAERAKSTGRHVDEDFIKRVHEQNEENKEYLANKVGFFKEVENDTDQLTDQVLLQAYKSVQSFFDRPVENPVGKRTLDKMKEYKAKYLAPDIYSIDVIKKKIESWYRK
jgi:predicted ABC-type ATPase